MDAKIFGTDIHETKKMDLNDLNYPETFIWCH